MLIAGGSANWSRRTNLYNDSESTKPKWTAYLIVRTPNIGIKIYRTAVIPIITETGTFDPLKPENTFWSSFWLFRNLHIYIYIYIYIIKEGCWPEQVYRVLNHMKRSIMITNQCFSERRDNTDYKSNNLWKQSSKGGQSSYRLNTET
jgi:hypothetical protein